MRLEIETDTDDLLSIKEFSKITGVETSTLRYWDEIGLFSPVKRNRETNYRYYSLVQIIALNFVTVLTDLDIPLKTVAELRDERDPEKFLDLMDRQEKKMDMEIRALRHRYSIIHARRELINSGLKVQEGQLSIEHRESMPVILWPPNVYSEDGDTFIETLAAFIPKTGQHNINLSYPVGGYFEKFDSFKKGPDKPDNFISVDPVGAHMIKEGDYLVGYTRGFYGEMGDLPIRMQTYIKEHDLRFAGPVYVLYLHDEICLIDPNQLLVQVIVAVAKKSHRKQD